MRHLLISALLTLGACSSISDRELALQVVHVMDVAQTYQIAKSPCHTEGDFVTKHLIGENPHTDGVLMWGVAQVFVNHYLEKHLPDTVMGLNFAFRAGVVNKNTVEGLTPSNYSCIGSI